MAAALPGGGGSSADFLSEFLGQITKASKYATSPRILEPRRHGSGAAMKLSA